MFQPFQSSADFARASGRSVRGFLMPLLLAGLSGLVACHPADRGVAETSSDAADHRILLAGSSTVAPFITTAAEYFGVTTDFPTPVVETTGTGGGFRIFCAGMGLKTSSVATASRPMTDGEKTYCRENGVSEILELEFGKDGIVLINALDGPDLAFSERDIFLALAEWVPTEAGFRENPYQKWSQIDADLPGVNIEIYGPPPTSGTRDAFVELVMEAGADEFGQLTELKRRDRAAYLQRAHTLRNDGRWLDSGENDAQIIQSLARSKESLGVVGFSYLDQNGDRVKPALIDGIRPDFDTISKGEYGITRSLFLYVKKDHFEKLPGLRAFLEEVYSDAAMGEAGYLVEKGLIPLTAERRTAARRQFQQ
jgi:phosphate transport system substrate-binding protein